MMARGLRGVDKIGGFSRVMIEHFVVRGAQFIACDLSIRHPKA
jgi:hypothetical protein